MDSIQGNLYNHLELSSSATTEQIKKAYKKLAMDYHPDRQRHADTESKSVAEEKFKEISNAYEILTDKVKRAEYDKTNRTPTSSSRTFSTSFYYANFQHTIHCMLDCSLEELYTGCQKYVRMNATSEPITVTVFAGASDNSKIILKTFFGHHDANRGNFSNDIELTIRCDGHSIFRRQENDLIMQQKINLHEAILGWQRKIRRLDGTTMNIAHHDISRPRQHIIVENEGMPITSTSRKGNLIIVIEIIFPLFLTPRQKTAFAACSGFETMLS